MLLHDAAIENRTKIIIKKSIKNSHKKTFLLKFYGNLRGGPLLLVRLLLYSCSYGFYLFDRDDLNGGGTGNSASPPVSN